MQNQWSSDNNRIKNKISAMRYGDPSSRCLNQSVAAPDFSGAAAVLLKENNDK